MVQKIGKSLLAGILIGIGGAIFVSTSVNGLHNKILGAFLFSFGLFYICNQGWYLFTGRIGYFFDYPLKEKLELLLVLGMNILGVVVVGYLMKLTNSNFSKDICNKLIETKLDISYLSFFVKSFFCGVMMILAVEGYRNFSSPLSKTLSIIFAVVIFILAGFEHSIADLFYIAYANFSYLSGNLIFKVLLAILGNALGSISLYSLIKISTKE